MGKGGQLRICPDMSGGRHTQSDSAGGSTGTVRMPIGVYQIGLNIAATWRMRLNRPCAAAMQPYVKSHVVQLRSNF